MLLRRAIKFPTNKRMFSCNYNEPMLFGPMFSSFFFGGVFTSMIMGTITSSHVAIKQDLDEIKKELVKLQKK
jgi:hypothetical protein